MHPRHVRAQHRVHPGLVAGTAGAEFEVVVYPDVAHAFSQPYARQANMEGIAYDERADNDAWRRMLALLDAVYE